MNERLKELRNVLNLSGEKFGQRLGVTRASISNIENGNRSLTEQMIKAICREFDVNEDWLRNGVGEMFSNSKLSSLEEFGDKYDLDSLDRSIIKMYVSMSKEKRAVIKDYIISVSEHYESGKVNIEEELDSYRRELEAEQKGAEMSSVSDGIKES